MNRRRFLELSGLTTLALAYAACASTVDRDDPDGAAPADGSPPDGSASDAATEASARFVIHEAFDVVLNDTSCSGHDHQIHVDPRSYDDDTPVHFLGGSHELVFAPSDLMRLERGEALPFATIGPGPGHGHCGLAFRMGTREPSRTRVDVCVPVGTAVCVR